MGEWRRCYSRGVRGCGAGWWGGEVLQRIPVVGSSFPRGHFIAERGEGGGVGLEMGVAHLFQPWPSLAEPRENFFLLLCRTELLGEAL